MADVTKFFRVATGVSFDNADTAIFSGSVDPQATSEQAPIGSIYLRTNGELWQKYGAGNSEWKIILTYVSVGLLTEPTFTDNGDGTCNLSTCIVALRSDSSHTNPIKLYTVSAVTNLDSFTNNGRDFIYIDYNSGTPIYGVTSTFETINESDRTLIRKVWRVGTTLHSIDTDLLGKGLPNKTSQMLCRTEPYRREDNTGLALSESATPNPRTIIVSESHVYAGSVHQLVSAYNSSTDLLTLATVTTGTWSYNSSSQVYEASNYNPPSGPTAINSANGGWYAVRWIYRSIGDIKEVFYVLGTSHYRYIADARLELIRSDLPEVIKGHCVLVGRIIVRLNGTSGEISSAWEQVFQGSSVTNHNDLSSKDGGDSALNEYYHNSLSQYQFTRKTSFARLGTTGALPNSPTYNNGTDGVGATLTAGSNTTLASQNGYTLALGERLLVKNQTAGVQNGLYSLTQEGSGSLPWILTRVTDADSLNNLYNKFIVIQEGFTLCNTIWEDISFAFGRNLGEILSSIAWTRSTTTATITSSSHKLSTGMQIDVTVTSDSGAITTGLKTITVTGVDTFTFSCINGGAGSGTISYTLSYLFVPLLTPSGPTSTNGQVLIWNNTLSKYVPASITGASNRLTVTLGAGSIGLTTPQDTHTSAVLRFARLGLGATADVTARILAVETTGIGTWDSLNVPTKFMRVRCATTTILPNTPTYANGTAGVGATLTSATNNAFPAVDGITLAVNERILVKNQVNSIHNGVYQLSQQGTGSVPWILTRCVDSDTPTRLTASQFSVNEGTVNGGVMFDCTFKFSEVIGTNNILFYKDAQENTTPTFVDEFSSDMNRTQATLGSDTRMFTGVPLSEKGKFKVAMTIGSGNLTATISFVGANTSFAYYINGKKFIVTATELSAYTRTVTNANGLWFFYIDATTSDVASPVMQLVQVPWAILNPDVLLWNALVSGTTVVWVGEERHTAGRDIFQHARNHSQGAIYREGLTFSQYNNLSAYTTNNDNNFGRAMITIGNGSFWDEDLLNSIQHTDASYGSTKDSPNTDWNGLVDQFLGFRAIQTSAVAGTITFPTTRTLVTGQPVTVMAGNTNTLRGTFVITTGATGTSFAVTTVTGSNAFANGDAVVVGGRIPIYYLSASNTWTKLSASDFPIIMSSAGATTANIASGVPQYLLPSTFTLTSVTNQRFFPMYLIATNTTSEPIICLCGQGQSTNNTLATALAEAPFQFNNLTGLLGLSFQEIVPIYRLVFEYNSGAGYNSNRARLRDASFLNIRVSSVSGSVIGTSPSSLPASAITTNTTTFNRVLTTAETDVQQALDKLDDLVLSTNPSEISTLTEKTTLVNNDLFIIEDSEDSNNKKKVKKSNIGTGGGVSAHASLTQLDYESAGHTGFGRLDYSSTVDPTTDNDGVDTASLGVIFRVGDKWINTALGDEYVCIDNTTGSALWKPTTKGGIIFVDCYDQSSPATTSGLASIDGVTLVAGVTRILVGNDSTAVNRGVWVAQVAGWTRATDADTIDKVIGKSVHIREGAVYQGLRSNNCNAITDSDTNQQWKIDVREQQGGAIGLVIYPNGKIERKRCFFMTFTASETLNSSGESDYLYYMRASGGINASHKSGKNNGVQYADTPSPAHVPVTGKIIKAILTLRGAGVGTGTVTYPVACQFDLNSQRWTADTTKIGDIDFSISNAFTVGVWGPGDTNFNGTATLDINVTEGDLVGLKYIRGAGVNNITRDIFHAYVTLIIEES